MFRKSYLPKVEIKQDFGTKKWFAYIPGDLFTYKDFVQFESGEYGFSSICKTTQFPTIDDLIEALYFYAMKEHLDQIKKNLTYNSVNIRT